MNGAKHKSKVAREKNLKVKKEDYIVPEGGLVVEGGPMLRPGRLNVHYNWFYVVNLCSKFGLIDCGKCFRL
jgi:hypothetical protein